MIMILKTVTHVTRTCFVSLNGFEEASCHVGKLPMEKAMEQGAKNSLLDNNQQETEAFA